MAAAADILARVDAPNLRIAPSIALLSHQEACPRDKADILKGKVGLWLLSAPSRDENGRLWSVNAPAAGRLPAKSVSDWLALAPEAPVALDGVYGNQSEEYADARLVEP